MTKDKAIAELVRIWHSPHLGLSLKAGLGETIDALKGEDGDLISRGEAVALVNRAIRGIDDKDAQEYLFDGLRKQMWALPSAEPEQYGRVFNGIVVEYPSINTYPEYEGKPYFQIKYTENGQEFIGYGTYKPEVLSEFLKEYFMPSAEPKTGKWYIREYEYFTCSECGEDYWNSCDSTAEAKELLETGEVPNYCPNCGARMKGGEEE